ncbi:MAG TPA: RagB/SusD family nutrient uptake outer membrane protein [Mucilaginibacter sp.]|nr:RagB/SusD family nutrient uptake outer membrane protein [Mucilaginibacter sp.]
MKKNMKLKRGWMPFGRYNIFGIFLFLICTYSCKKYVQVDPPSTQIVGSVVFNNNISAAAAMSGVYDQMMQSPSGTFSGGSASISLECGLMADELKNYYTGSIVYSQFYTNTLSSSSSTGTSNYYFWSELYADIHICNNVIEGLAKSTGITPAIKRQLTGEAKFMRAFFHFYAVNLYGDVPLVLTSDYITNNSIKRSTKTEVYQQIIQDLKDAQVALTDNFVDASGVITTGRIRPNKNAATALLARAYLYLGDLNHDATMYNHAEEQATEIIGNANYSLSSDLTNTFLANSSEAIWQLQRVNPLINTFDAFYFVLTAAPGTSAKPVALSTNLINAFETGDKRFTFWVGSKMSGSTTYYYPYKYKVNLTNQPLTEYQMVLRLAEQYLIRSEARAQQGNISGAQGDLNVIRSRAGLPNTTGNDKGSLLTAINHERQVEMFTEWGHRWLDLKRTGAVDPIMSIVTPTKGGGAWDSNKSLMPLPSGDLLVDPNLTQNPGYN